ncbi:hypothetical protein EMPG_15754 [Blastomyces silverae]|uniref:Uncharacterized protein n=1 Tax=Blastomyces silverae TaxID=2060906 RepID=A0A0H1BBV7_9EURO|nr:hypothetical protein EMPG_15754 [Blastomyces silverae]
MRLLNPRTLEFKEFNQDLPQYAIFSHTWYSQPLSEILYHDIKNYFSGRVEIGPNGLIANTSAYPTIPPALQKVVWCCQQTILDGFEWIWIDTCCLNKDSAVEDSEAVNAMFTWYRNAMTCYVYLSDVDITTRLLRDRSGAFSNSKWFKRGWTLQELLAPPNVYFYDRGWQLIGTKYSMKPHISTITTIDEETLMNQRGLAESSIARRMSWAARRETTRAEDIAYCLMGIFGVNMPLLYGEGAEKAFIRLQEEIMRKSEDHTLFAWTSVDDGRTLQPGRKPRGPLALSPSEFASSADFTPTTDAKYPSEPYTMTNCGLEISLPIVPDGDAYIAWLNCLDKDYQRVGIRIQELKFEPRRYYRIDSNILIDNLPLPPPGRTLAYLKQGHGTNNNSFWLNTNLGSQGFGFRLVPEGRWKPEWNVIQLPVDSANPASRRSTLVVEKPVPGTEQGFEIVFGFPPDDDDNPSCGVYPLLNGEPNLNHQLRHGVGYAWLKIGLYTIEVNVIRKDAVNDLIVMCLEYESNY